jgi:hypothetical protein
MPKDRVIVRRRERPKATRPTEVEVGQQGRAEVGAAQAEMAGLAAIDDTARTYCIEQ